MAFGAGLFGAYRIGVMLDLSSNVPQQTTYINRDLLAMQAQMRELQATALRTRQALTLSGTNAERAALQNSLKLQTAAIQGQRAQLLLTQNQVVKERELFNQRKAQMAELETRRASVNSQVSGLVTAGAVGVGLLSGAAIVSGVEGAARLQLAMTTVGQATGATTEQLQKLNDMVLQVSGVTAQSADTIAQEMATAARAGLNSFQRLSQAFPQLARFADVQMFAARAAGRDVSPVDMVNVGVQFSHYFQAYSGAKLQKMLDDLNRLMFTQPEDINKLLTQGKYFIPLATRLGMPEPEIMDILATMGQTGFLRGKGGTGVQNTLLGAINVATMTGHLQGARLRALQDLGLIDKSGDKTFLDANGNIDPQLLFGMLTASARQMPSTQFIGDLSNAFGKQATQFLSVFTGPGVQMQLSFIDAAMKRMGTVEQFFDSFFSNLLPQIQRAQTNLNILLIDVFKTQLPTLTQFFKGLADALGALGDFFAKHPSAAMTAAIGTMAGLGTAIAALAAQAILWLNRLSMEIAQLGLVAKAAAASGAVAGAEGAAGEAGSMAKGGLLALAGSWALRSLSGVGKFLAPLVNVGKSIGEFIADVMPGLLRLGGWIATLGVLVYDFFKHPFDLGVFLGKIVGWFEFKFFPGVIAELQKGWPKVSATLSSLWSDIINGWVNLISKLAWVIQHPWDAARVALQLAGGALSSLGNTIKADYAKTQQGYVHGMSLESQSNILGAHAPIVVHHHHGDIHVHSNAHDPKKVADAVLDEFGRRTRSALRGNGTTPSHPNFSHHEAVAVA